MITALARSRTDCLRDIGDIGACNAAAPNATFIWAAIANIAAIRRSPCRFWKRSSVHWRFAEAGTPDIGPAADNPLSGAMSGKADLHRNKKSVSTTNLSGIWQVDLRPDNCRSFYISAAESRIAAGARVRVRRDYGCLWIWSAPRRASGR